MVPLPLMRFGVAALLMPLLSTPVFSQRAVARHDAGGARVELDHGTPDVGDHTPERLLPGTTWRLGDGNASIFRTELPLLGAPGTWLAPGEYRVGLQRGREDGVYWLQFDGGPVGIGSPETSAQTLFRGEFHTVRSRTGQLRIRIDEREIESQPTTGEARGREPDGEGIDRFANLQPFAVTIQFGKWQVEVPVTAVPEAEPVKAGGRHRLMPFQVPAEIVEERRVVNEPVVLGRLDPRRKPRSREPQGHNLVLVGDELRLAPLPRAPEEHFGFGVVQVWPEAWHSSASVEWLTRDSSSELLQVTEVEVDKRTGLSVTFAFGERIGTATLVIPNGRAARR